MQADEEYENERLDHLGIGAARVSRNRTGGMDRSAGRVEKESGQYWNRNDGHGAQRIRLQQSSVVPGAPIL